MKMKPGLGLKPVRTWALPTAPSVPSGHLGDYSMLIYGQEKIGKTDLAAQFPESMFFMFEPGGKAQSIFQTEIESWLHFEDLLRQVKASTRFRTLVMDTADIAYQMCKAYICKQEGWDDPGDAGFGKGWNKVNGRFAEAVNGMLKMGRGCIYISHAQEKEITTRLGDKYDRIVPTMGNGARNICEALVDIWGYMYYDKVGTRVMRIRALDHVAAGHRLKKNFIGVETIPMGLSAEQGYRNLVAAFNNNLEQPKKLLLAKSK